MDVFTGEIRLAEVCVDVGLILEDLSWSSVAHALL